MNSQLNPTSDPQHAGPLQSGATPRERRRVAWAVLRYDFWLEWYDFPWRRRRSARRELRANLWAAAEATSVVVALVDLGDVRVLAKAMASGARSSVGRRLALGSTAAGVTLAILLVLSVLSGAAFIQGATAAADAGTASSRIFPWLSVVSVTWGPEVFEVSTDLSIGLLLLPLAAFLVVSRPWSMRRGSGPVVES